MLEHIASRLGKPLTCSIIAFLSTYILTINFKSSIISAAIIFILGILNVTKSFAYILTVLVLIFGVASTVAPSVKERARNLISQTAASIR
jgi:hypothetical protein